ncbi:hypothetical protein PpBr36_08104 [Pyricularia pennisetigena]|uniref:hypothetical protein n=1 Tax=Pyricularia pennisetigena TaxID=1578925 RepID=UPI001150A4AF|nr:hypothetical protein PpBr36_08104 [Pyricularia pennisetigena]TLS24072.1 hypothetical protein PpBr36_08104 [Pyricularia pennisetigena]
MTAAARDSVIWAETLRALSKAVKRKDYDSDSDDYIEHSTNRGRKLKRRARFVRQGQLGPPNGPATYRETVEHAGYQRTIISRNPPLVDEEGYELDSDDDEERIAEVQAAVAEDDPYSGIRIDEILAPLTSAADLANHPALSHPFRSSALTELTTQGLGLLHKEREALANVRPLLTRLCGDHTWASCVMMLGPNDEELFTSMRNGNGVFNQPRPNGASADNTGEPSPHTNGTGVKVNGLHPKAQESTPGAGKKTQTPAEEEDPDVTMEDIESPKQKSTEVNGSKASKPASGDEKSTEDKTTGGGNQDEHFDPDETIGEDEATGAADAAEPSANGKPGSGGLAKAINGSEANGMDLDIQADQQSGLAKEAAINGSRAASTIVDSLHEEAIHPYFMAPPSAYPNRDAGLPEGEAEEVRRLLQLYVQKQEEVCRGTKDLYEGLLRADRMRKEVLKWSKAEAHCGANRDMSDGEDWYDKEEWGLVEDLKKGQDEEEEDTTTRDQPKKTRNRR